MIEMRNINKTYRSELVETRAKLQAVLGVLVRP